jgi:hypothetical protein
MRPRFPEPVTLRTPGAATSDPDTGNPRPGPTIVEESQARISQSPVANIGSQVELLATQDTTISFWTIQTPPETSATMTSKTEVEDSRGRVFHIVGDVADRPNHRPKFRAAAMRLISDTQ